MCKLLIKIHVYINALLQVFIVVSECFVQMAVVCSVREIQFVAATYIGIM
jgi:hypothetical protein